MDDDVVTSILLDTNAFLWLAARPDRIPKTAREVPQDQRNDLYVSAVRASSCGEPRRPAGPATLVGPRPRHRVPAKCQNPPLYKRVPQQRPPDLLSSTNGARGQRQKGTT